MLMTEIPSDDFQRSGKEFHLSKKKLFTSRFVNDIQRGEGGDASVNNEQYVTIHQM